MVNAGCFEPVGVFFKLLPTLAAGLTSDSIRNSPMARSKMAITYPRTRLAVSIDPRRSILRSAARIKRPSISETGSLPNSG